jgi:hypothetical protein
MSNQTTTSDERDNRQRGDVAFDAEGFLSSLFVTPDYPYSPTVVVPEPTEAEPFNIATACALMDAADAHVELSGVPGTHPTIRSAVETVTAAYLKRDMQVLRFALAELEAAVTALTAPV